MIDREWTLLTPPKGAAREKQLDEPQLRIWKRPHGPLVGALTARAHELLGYPLAIGVALDHGGRYSIVPLDPGDPHAMTLGANRRVSLGVLGEPLRGARYPVLVRLQPDGDQRLVFAEIVQEARG